MSGATLLQQDVILPEAAELVYGVVAFVVVVALVVAVVVLFLRGSRRRSARAEIEHWRERALRAEAERDLLRGDDTPSP